MKKRKPATLLRMPKRSGTPLFAVESRILILRHKRVILDRDLAELYGVTVKRLNQRHAQSGALSLRFYVPTQFAGE
jgi:hypothetical protein